VFFLHYERIALLNVRLYRLLCFYTSLYYITFSV
jgi:hypothetical protein